MAEPDKTLPHRHLLKILVAFGAGILVSAAFLRSPHLGGKSTPQPRFTAADAERFASPTPRLQIETLPNASASPLPQQADFGAQHIEDEKQQADQDTRMFAAVLGLSSAQQEALNRILMEHRLSSAPLPESESKAITRLLSSEQAALYSDYLDKKRQSSIERHAAVQLNEVELVTGPLTDAQKDLIFANFLARDKDEQVISDRELLKPVLTDQQLSLWTKSVFATPEK